MFMSCVQGRTRVLQVLSRIELVNSIVALLSIDFHKLETDVKKEQQLRQKVWPMADDVTRDHVHCTTSLH